MSASQFFVVARNSTTWYYTPYPIPALAVPAAFTSIDASALTSVGNSRVRMKTADKVGGSTKCYFASPDFNTIGSWDGPGNAIVAVSGSPSNCRYIELYQGSLVLAGSSANPYTIYFSNAGDPDTWPSLNAINVPSERGPVTGIFVTPNGLIIFCQWSINLFTGTLNTSQIGAFSLQPINPDIGCDLDDSLSENSGVFVFSFQGNFYEMAAQPSLIGQKVLGLGNVVPLGVSVNNGSGCLTPNRYTFRQMTNTSPSSSPASTTGLPTRLFNFDRTKFQNWGSFTYPTTTSLGASQPFIPLVFWPQADVYFLNGGDGNIYVQPFRNSLEADIEGSGGIFNTPYTPDAGGIPVSMRIRSGVVRNPGITMLIRRLFVSGWAAAYTTTVQFYTYGENGTRQIETVVQGGSVPLMSELMAVDGNSGIGEVSALQIDLITQAAYIDSIELEWLPVRRYYGEALL